MNKNIEKQTFEAKLDDLYLMLSLIENNAEHAKFPEGDINKITVAVEEILVNIIKYAYPETSGQIEIKCTILGKKKLKITISDDGIPFNPLQAIKQIDTDSLIETRHVGGFGLFLADQIMSNLSYERKDSQNILTMTKK